MLQTPKKAFLLHASEKSNLNILCCYRNCCIDLDMYLGHFGGNQRRAYIE